MSDHSLHHRPPANLITATLTALGLALSAPTQAWWGAGHSALCDAALQQVSAPTRAAIEQLMLDNDTAAEGYATFGSQCVWADDIKPNQPETGPWHYLNVPDDIDNVMFTPRPEQGDILSGIERYLPILADQQRTSAERLEALRFVGHFIGDLHQPMHLGYEADWGGNKYRLALSPEIKVLLHEGERNHTNMHAVWDGYLLIYAREEAGEGLVPLLMQNLPVADGNYLDWANESLAIARSHPVQYATDDRLNQLDERYLAANAQTAITRLRHGAARLASLLDNVFAQ